MAIGSASSVLDLLPHPAVLRDFERLDRGLPAARKVLISPRTRGRPERLALEWLSSRSDVWHTSDTRLRMLARRMRKEAGLDM